MKLYIIRHGQTDWNVQGRIQGRQDIPLNAAGRSQAQMLAKGMEKRPVTAIYSSPQLRAMETAKALAGNQGVEVIPLPELVEIGYGDWEGRTASDILTKERKLYEEWWQHPATVAPPGGETLNQVDARCKKAWERIKGEIKGTRLWWPTGERWPILLSIFWRAGRMQPKLLWEMPASPP